MIFDGIKGRICVYVASWPYINQNGKTNILNEIWPFKIKLQFQSIKNLKYRYDYNVETRVNLSCFRFNFTVISFNQHTLSKMDWSYKYKEGGLGPTNV